MAKKCEHEIIQLENDFITGMWLVRCQECRLSTDWNWTKEGALQEWKEKKVED